MPSADHPLFDALISAHHDPDPRARARHFPSVPPLTQRERARPALVASLRRIGVGLVAPAIVARPVAVALCPCESAAC